jgi:hypothetical protein
MTFRPLLFLLLGAALLSYPSEAAEKPKAVAINRAAVPDAQLNVKPSYDEGEPIRIGCTCKPVDGVTLTTEWTWDSGLKAIDIDDLTKDFWAKKGPHKVSVKLKMLRTHKLSVLVPGPGWPADPKDIKQQQIEVFDSYTESTLEGEFVQQGAVTPPEPPPPPIDPPKPPDPTPAVGPLKVLILEETADRSKYSKDVTGCYLSAAVASYLKTHTTQTGGFSDWAIWDDDAVLGADLSNWADIYAKAKVQSGANTATALEPWVIIEQKDAAGKPVTVHSGPVTADLLNTLKKFGGP